MTSLLVVEPSALESAKSIAQGYDVIAPGPDLTPYFANRVILWPDASLASRSAFHALAKSVAAVASEVKILLPNGQPDGWNIAKASQDGWTWKQLTDWAKTRLIIMPKLEIEVTEAADPVPADVEALWDQLGIARTKSGAPINNVDNVVRVLSGWPAFQNLVWFDEFHQRFFRADLELRPVEWRDIDDINLTITLQREFGLTKVTASIVNDAIRARGIQCQRNEPVDWMRSLKWDGTHRIDRFFIDYFGHAENPYIFAVGRNFWLSMIARAFHPGCQVDNMVILEGKQGIYKSRALEAIGGKWYMEAAEEITSKDFFLGLQGKLIVEIADLDSFSRADTNRIKKVITCRSDRYRAPYGHWAQDYPRRSIFVGTTNEFNYLKDNTGARRFWPIACHHISLDAIKRDREQLFAEAVTRYLANEDWYKMPTEVTLSAQEDRRQYDEWETLIQDYLAHSLNGSDLVLSDIAKAVGIDPAHLDVGVQRRLGAILRRLGYEAKTVRRGDFTKRVWVSSALASPDSPSPLLLIPHS